jgi:hypothetical protein
MASKAAKRFLIPLQGIGSGLDTTAWVSSALALSDTRNSQSSAACDVKLFKVWARVSVRSRSVKASWRALTANGVMIRNDDIIYTSATHQLFEYHDRRTVPTNAAFVGPKDVAIPAFVHFKTGNCATLTH